MPESRSHAPLVWIDCEMTGLSSSSDTILSLACFITDSHLNLLCPHGYSAIISHSASQLSSMSPWCLTQHSASGLTASCLASNVTAEQAAAELLAYVQRHVPEQGTGLLAGNSVHADKAFLEREPWRGVVEWLGYRILDVSAVKEAARRWAPEEVLARSPAKEGRHEARADILESIEEARFYKEVFFEGKVLANDL